MNRRKGHGLVATLQIPSTGLTGKVREIETDGHSLSILQPADFAPRRRSLFAPDEIPPYHFGMESRLHLDIAPQPDNNTCGPTCLHAIYNYYGDRIALPQIISETPALEEGGTLAVLLGCHALARGYSVSLFTWNLTVFDPTWFQEGGPPIADRLRAQMAAKDIPKLRLASQAYLEFLRLGGRLRMEDMTGTLLRKYLKRAVPILAGLSATYLYNEPRECGLEGRPDDVNGTPQGHFVVLCGYDAHERSVLVADPLQPNPFSAHTQRYEVDLDRLMCAIMLGVVTYDSNLLVIQPKGRKENLAPGEESAPPAPPAPPPPFVTD